MPLHGQHNRQKSKNYTLFFVLLGLVALIYAISIMRMSG